MQIQRFKVSKLKDLWLDFDEIVVRKIDPFQLVVVPHDNAQSVIQSGDVSQEVTRQEQRLALFGDFLLLVLLIIILSPRVEISLGLIQ